MAAVMAVFVAFISIFRALEGILSSLVKIGCPFRMVFSPESLA